MKETPMMRQYIGFKKQYPDMVVLFRMGDFYETFHDDAKLVSKVLNITLTTRDKKSDPTPLAGFPYHALDQYLPKLINAGLNAVVVDQLEDPKLAKGVVKRGVTRIVTPGTLDGELASDEKDPFLMSLYKKKNLLGVTLCDVSTGELKVAELLYSSDAIIDLINSFEPVEIVLDQDFEDIGISTIPRQVHELPSKNLGKISEYISNFLNVPSIQSVGIERLSAGIFSLGLLLSYVEETQKMTPEHIDRPKLMSLSKNMILDSSTIRNLDLIRNSTSGSTDESLLGVMDSTSTLMGKRKLHGWVLNPLIDLNEINSRLNIVEVFVQETELRESILENLHEISDVERIVGKIGLDRVNGRDLNALAQSLRFMVETLSLLEKNKVLKKLLLVERKDEIDLDLINEVITKIEISIVEDPPNTVTEGGVIKDGVIPEVDNMRSIRNNSKEWLHDLERSQRDKYKIPSLKVGFNKVFGYYLEVTKVHQDKVPEHYIRKQTLVNSERFITEDLKEKEEIILNSEEKISQLEYKFFQNLRNEFLPSLKEIRKLSNLISEVDILVGFANNALYNEYVKPNLHDFGKKGGILDIAEGRHPVVEKISSDPFITNNSKMSIENERMAIITGPNMSGKSTYIRQVALIVLMSQIGSFVPATSAEFSITDRVFSRVGASDDLAAGRSTFMVEMEEAANIINNASSNSLIILDEVGRGTSTYDGVSIAWSLIEHLVNDIKARTLFATHYHELVNLEEEYPDLIKNYNVEVKEKGDEVIFMRNIIEGGTDQSYGIYVAQMAGLPSKIINRANQIISNLKVDLKEAGKDNSTDQKRSVKSGEVQFELFDSKNILKEELDKVDPNRITPLEALEILDKLKKMSDHKDK